MAEDFAATLFAEARTHHEAAGRRFVIAAAALAVFHLVIFQPYVDLTGRKALSAEALARDMALRQELDGVAPELARLGALGTDAAKRRLDDLLVDLRIAFGQLNGIVAALREMGPERAEGEPGARQFPPSGRLSMMVQMPIANAIAQTAAAPSADAGAPDLPAMEPALRRAVAEAGSQHAVLDSLRPYIEQQIVAPRFARFNDEWREQVVPPVKEAGAALVGRIRAAGQRFPGEAESWAGAERAVAGIVDAVDRFAIAPPADPFWWAAAAGKGAAVEGFLRVISESALQRATALADLEQRTEAAVAANQRQQAQIDAAIARLNEEFRAQQNELAAMVEPLKGISIDLATVVPWFPVILGACLIAFTGWLASRIRQLVDAVAMVARRDPESDAPAWLRGRILASPWHRGDAIAGRATVLVAWIALASWQLAAAALVGPLQAALFVAVGAAGIAAASYYEWRVVHGRAAALSGDDTGH